MYKGYNHDLCMEDTKQYTSLLGWLACLLRGRRMTVDKRSMVAPNMKISDFTVSLLPWVVALTAARQVQCGTLNENGGHVTRNTCDTSQLYRDLMALRDNHNCTGDTQVWGMLDRLYHERNGPDCMKQAITHLNDKFEETETTPAYCNCTGFISHHEYLHVPGFGVSSNSKKDVGEHVHTCLEDDSFKYLYQLHFGQQSQRQSRCMSHHRVWNKLASIESDQCRNEIVRHVAVVISGDQCSCQNKETAVQQMNHASSNAAHSDHCFTYGSYKYLYDLSLHVDRCVSVNSMWHYLADLQNTDVSCRRQILDRMNAVFHNQQTSVNCFCTGHDTYHSIVHLDNLDQESCKKVHASYRILHNEIYENSPSPCKSHQYLWQILNEINVLHGERDCRADIILHAAVTYPLPRNDPCSCTQVAATSPSTSVPWTITPSTTQEATYMLTGLHTCNKALTIVEIAHNVTLAHDNASDCIPGDHKSSEAFVFVSCNTSSAESWIKGENVMSVCRRIPLFTPIATFKADGVQTSAAGTTGIFLGCLTDGFKFAFQDCHSGIQIKHLLIGGASADDPSTYFVVRW